MTDTVQLVMLLVLILAMMAFYLSILIGTGVGLVRLFILGIRKLQGDK